jgi:hypothetical protein
MHDHDSARTHSAALASAQAREAAKRRRRLRRQPTNAAQMKPHDPRTATGAGTGGTRDRLDRLDRLAVEAKIHADARARKRLRTRIQRGHRGWAKCWRRKLARVSP